MDYGTVHRGRKTTKAEIIRILKYCRQHNIHTIDTAASYGNSEEILGELLTDTFFSIYSKIPYLNVSHISDKDVSRADKTFHQTLNKLQVNHLEGIFIHNANDLLVKNSNKLIQLLSNWKKAGLIKKIGVSVYNENQIRTIMNHYHIDVVQIPINIYDQRFIHSDILNKMKNRNIEIHARSIFLQGVLLLNKDNFPRQFEMLKPHQQKLESFLYHHGLTKLEGALQFILQIKQIDSVVVGFNNLHQITEFVRSLHTVSQANKTISFRDFQVTDINLIDPRKW